MDIDDRGFSQRSHRLFHDASHLQEKNIDFRVTQFFFFYFLCGKHSSSVFKREFKSNVCWLIVLRNKSQCKAFRNLV